MTRKHSAGTRQQCRNPIFYQNWSLATFIELIVASNVLALVLTLAEAGTWAAFDGLRLLQYILFINWVVLLFRH